MNSPGCSVPEVLTEDEAASFLRLKAETLRAWRHRRKNGPPYIQAHSHGRVLYQRSDLVDWLRANRVNPRRKSTP